MLSFNFSSTVSFFIRPNFSLASSKLILVISSTIFISKHKFIISSIVYPITINKDKAAPAETPAHVWTFSKNFFSSKSLFIHPINRNPLAHEGPAIITSGFHIL